MKKRIVLGMLAFIIASLSVAIVAAQQPPSPPQAEQPPSRPQADQPPSPPQAEQPPSPPQAEQPPSRPQVDQPQPPQQPNAPQPPQHPDQPQQPRAPRPPHDPLGNAMFPPDMIMQHQRELGLTEDQKTFMRGEIQRTTARFTELQWQLHDSMEVLQETMKANVVNEQQALAQLDKVLESEREIKRLHMELGIRIKNRLTPEQQTKLQDMRHGPGFGGGPGRGPGHGPGRGPGTGPPRAPRPEGPGPGAPRPSQPIEF
jgi:Spy/CpxP family protein refolding chaperone